MRKGCVVSLKVRAVPLASTSASSSAWLDSEECGSEEPCTPVEIAPPICRVASGAGEVEA